MPSETSKYITSQLLKKIKLTQSNYCSTLIKFEQATFILHTPIIKKMADKRIKFSSMISIAKTSIQIAVQKVQQGTDWTFHAIYNEILICHKTKY
jgi:hypothetical protein